MLGLGTAELVILFLVLLLVFGASRLPKLARSTGEAGKELRDASQPSDDKRE